MAYYSRWRTNSLKIRGSFCVIYGLFCFLKLYMQHLKSENISSLVSMTEADISVPEMSSNLHRHLLALHIVRPSSSFNCTPLAVDNFPSDIFTHAQLRSGAIILHFSCALYMFIALAILCDEYFIPCLERICEVLRLQPDVAGATFMAAGSSAPELATTLVGVFIAKDDIGLGAVVGSADFNVMFVISVTALFAKTVLCLSWWPLVRDSVFYLFSIILLALIIRDESVYWYEGLILLIVYVLYVLFMFCNPSVDAFFRNWCQRHPTCCPRVLHTKAEESESAAQHTGAFPTLCEHNMAPLDPLGVIVADAKPVSKYENLVNEELITNEIAVIEPSEPENFPKTSSDNAIIDTREFETRIQFTEEQDSWIETCIAPMRFPSRAAIPGRAYYAYAWFVWPIRFILALTVPDIRRTKWREFCGSHWIVFTMSCVWIGIFTSIMMWMITVIGYTLHIPDTVMGLTFIAAGSSVPDAIASVLVVREGEGDMAVSNAIGSNVFDILVCMGLPWFLKSVITGVPVIVYSKGLLYSTMTLFTTVLFLLGVTHLNRWRLTKPYGFTLLVGYFVVLVFCTLYELNLFGKVHLPECVSKSVRI